MLAALEDYHPENGDGTKNLDCNNVLFQRCSKLLQLIERCVTEKDFVCDDSADLQLVSKTGWLSYKRLKRRTIYSRKIWKNRYFSVLNGVLMCYTDETYAKLKRAMPLQGAIIQAVDNPKHENYFEVISPSTNTKYQLIAETSEEMESWIAVLTWEADRTKAFDNTISGSSTSNTHDNLTMDAPASNMRVITDSNRLVRRSSFLESPHRPLSPEEEKRHIFFRNQLHFIRQITDICERLRFIDRPLRKPELKREMGLIQIPKLAYIPLTNGTDPWTHVIRPLPEESHAFQTKARCPSLVYFECERFPSHITSRNVIGRAPSEDVTVTEFLKSELVSRYGSLIEPLPGSDGSKAVDVSSVEEMLPVQPKGFILGDSFAPRDSVWVSNEAFLDRVQKRNITLTTAMKETLVKRGGGAEATDLPNVSVEEKEVGNVSDLWGEYYNTKKQRLKEASYNGDASGWELKGFIAKSNDDVRQEVFVMQLIRLCQHIFQREKVPVFLYPYKILSTSKNTGLIELIPDSLSLDAIKKADGFPGSLALFFDKFFGGGYSPISKDDALQNYVKSMAGYSIVSYLLAIKDRHNGNIMLDNKGHIIHIDFGFVFGLAPGKAASLEKSPWKMTDELIEVMGGPDSNLTIQYKSLMTQAFKAARKHKDELIGLMEIMTYKSNFPSFKYNPRAKQDFVERLMLDVEDSRIQDKMEELFESSRNEQYLTHMYDQFQLLTNGIKI